MGKTKGRSRRLEKDFTERDTIREYQSVIRKLKKENDHLRRELRKRGDLSQEYNELLKETDFEQELNPLKPKDGCPNCKGTLMKINFGIKVVMTCNTCKYRKTQKVTE